MGPVLIALIALASAAYIYLTGQSMPATVASHFGVSGAPNGFMPRQGYVQFMAGLALGMPFLTGILPSLAVRGAGARVNIPNRDYWLAPERRAATLAWLRRHMVGMGAPVPPFLAYVHAQVLRANAEVPARLGLPQLLPGMVLLLLFIVAWSVMPLWHFRKER